MRCPSETNLQWKGLNYIYLSRATEVFRFHRVMPTSDDVGRSNKLRPEVGAVLKARSTAVRVHVDVSFFVDTLFVWFEGKS